MLIVGSSTVMGGRASGFSKSATVSPISKSSRPTTAQISPHSTFSALFFSSPWNTIRSLIFCFSTVPSFLQREICMPAVRAPRLTLPTAIRPT